LVTRATNGLAPSNFLHSEIKPRIRDFVSRLPDYRITQRSLVLIPSTLLAFEKKQSIVRSPSRKDPCHERKTLEKDVETTRTFKGFLRYVLNIASRHDAPSEKLVKT